MNEELINKWKSSLTLDIESDTSEDIETLEPVEEKDLAFEKELLLRERRKFEIERTLTYEKIHIEQETLKQEKNQFDRMRKQYEKKRRLDEETFQEAKLEFEKYKELEKMRMQLETKEIINNCSNFKEFLDDYKSGRD